MKVQSYYLLFKGLLEQLPTPKESFFVNKQQGDDYNLNIERLSNDIGVDLSSYKTEMSHEYHSPEYINSVLRSKLGMIIGFLEGEYNLLPNTNASPQHASPNVSVINNNTIAITISQDLQQLIDRSSNEEEREKLNELKDELSKSNKDWTKIKPILIWAINFSEKLFFQLLPIILKHSGFSS